jgi:lysophosphatidate acyltransferase
MCHSELDLLMLGAVMPRWSSVTAKKSLSKFPFLGQYMVLSGTVFLDRRDRKGAIAAFDNAANEMKVERQSVMIFPEGTRSHSRTPVLLPFKKGAFHLAVQAQVPIVPIIAPNYSNILHMKTMVFKRGIIPVKGKVILLTVIYRH